MRKLALVPVLLLLVACATPIAPSSFDQHILAAKSSLMLTNRTTTVLVNGGHVTKPAGAEVLKRTKQVRAAIELAEAAGSRPQLDSAVELLRAAQNYLCKDLPDNPNCALLMQQGAL